MRPPILTVRFRYRSENVAACSLVEGDQSWTPRSNTLWQPSFSERMSMTAFSLSLDGDVAVE